MIKNLKIIKEKFENIQKTNVKVWLKITVVLMIIIAVNAYFSLRVSRYLKYPYNLFLVSRLLFIPKSSLNPYLNFIMSLTGLLLDIFAGVILTFVYLELQKKGEDSHGTARWANIEEWEKAGLICKTEQYTNGVILGRADDKNKKTIVDCDKTHIAVVAPTRSGKGVGIIIPTLLNWNQSTLVLDMKGENHDITGGYRREVLKQKVLKYQPYSYTDSVSYNPLAEVRIGTIYEVKDATIIADILTDPGENKKRDHWDNSASAVFIGLILYVLYKAKDEGRMGSFGDVVDFLTDTSSPLDSRWKSLMTQPTSMNEEYIKSWSEYYSKQELYGLNKGVHPKVARTAAEIMNKDERERASVISTVMAKMTLFKDPIIRKNTTEVNFRISDLMDYETPVSLYIVVAAEAMETLSPLLRILITQVIGVLAPKMDFSSDTPPHKHKLLLMLDEFPAFGSIPLLEKALAYIAGYGMKAVIIAQALSQLTKNYGKENSVFDNCATAVFYAPTPLDKDTPQRISELLGETTIKVKSASWKAFSIGQKNISESNQARKLMTPEEVRNKLGDKRSIISVAGKYPFLAYKIRFYEEEYFTSKTNKKYGVPKLEYIYEKSTTEKEENQEQKSQEKNEKTIEKDNSKEQKIEKELKTKFVGKTTDDITKEEQNYYDNINLDDDFISELEYKMLTEEEDLTDEETKTEKNIGREKRVN